MRVLIVGASGFIGTALLDHLGGAQRPAHDSVKVYAVGRSAPRSSAGEVHHIAADLADEAQFEAALRSVPQPDRLDAVVHLAVSDRRREFPAAAREIFAVDTASVAALAQWAATNGVPRLVLGSTGSVYGWAEPHAESTRTEPIGFPASCRRAAEVAAMAWSDHLSVFVARLYFPYGPGLRGRLLADVVDRVRNGRPVLLAGGDGMILCPTHVDDVCQVLTQALTAPWTGLMNVSSTETFSLRAVAELVGDRLGVAPVFVSDGDAGPRRFEPELHRLASMVDLSTFRPFASGIADLLAIAPTS